MLLVLGVSVLAGGLRYRKQVFNRTAASMGATLLALGAIALIVPTVYYHLAKTGPPPGAEDVRKITCDNAAKFYNLTN